MANEDSTQDQRVGTIILDRYKIETVLGRGGMGAVYRAIQRPIERPVAIKLIALGVGGDSRQIVQRFQREAAAMAKLTHPNTVRLIEFGVTADNEMFLAMELLEGVDLAQHLNTHGAMPAAGALQIVKESLGSLAEAHAFGILHRDIKPANIFLSRMHDGEIFAKLMDFGIAHIAEGPGATKLTVTGSVMGTPAYMSPEQAMGKQLDARSDLYSLGVTLFHMLTGRTPFEAESMASQLVAHVTQAPPRLSEACPGRTFSPQLQSLLDALLSKEPDRRPQSAKDTLRSIELLLRSESSADSGSSATQPWAAAAQQPPASFAEQSTPQPVAVAIPHTILATQEPATGHTVSKRKWTPWLLAAAASFASIGATYVLMKRDDVATKQETHEAWHVTPAINKPPDAPPPPAGGLDEVKEPTPEAPRQVAVRAEPAPKTQAPVQTVNSPKHATAKPETAAPALAPPKAAPPAIPPATPVPQTPPSVAPVAIQPVAVAPKLAAAASPIQKLQAMPRADRKQYMLANWPPPYSSIATVKSAYKSATIDEAMYDDIIWALKMKRKALIQKERDNYQQGLITKAEYKQRANAIDRAYEGQ